MEDIPTERAGAVVACVAPLFSLRPDIHHWLYYYTGLGVSRFHMYVPTLHAHEQVHYDEPHEVWMTVKGFNFRLGETHTDPFHPFDHPLVSWHHYSPSNRENYFGQVSNISPDFPPSAPDSWAPLMVRVGHQHIRPIRSGRNAARGSQFVDREF